MANTDPCSVVPMNWCQHVVRAGPHCPPPDIELDPKKHREHIEPWLSALFQAEHLNVLVGSGFTTAIASTADAPVVDMRPVAFKSRYADAVTQATQKSAAHLGREEPNIEAQTRTIIELIGGLRILAGDPDADNGADPFRQTAAELRQEWESELDSALSSPFKKILETERGIHTVLEKASNRKSAQVRRLLGGFLLPFGSRAATRERTHVFTVNYDRLIEYGCDLLGLRVVDRFVGTLAPVFHSSRLGIDLHYNPPGIRGEPRYLEGVLCLTKLTVR